MHPKILFFALMALAVGFELVGDFYFKKWAITSSAGILGFGLLMYFIGTVFWAFSLKYETLSQAIMVFVLLSMIGAVMIGTLFFGEQLSMANKIGILLGIISVILVEYA